MKDAKMLIWLSQMGLGVAAPLGGCILLSVWLQRRFSLGNWVIVAGVLLGLICGAEGLISALKAADRMREKTKEEPPVSFNEHE